MHSGAPLNCHEEIPMPGACISQLTRAEMECMNCRKEEQIAVAPEGNKRVDGGYLKETGCNSNQNGRTELMGVLSLE